MNVTSRMAAIALAVALGGCSALTPASRDNPPQDRLLSASTRQAETDWHVAEIRVRVPENLTVSEANGYYPLADIVWRGDPPGDRRVQVAEILRAAMAEGLRDLQGSRPLRVDVEVLRFHSLTEKTRYSFGGTHSIHFRLTLSDAETGAVLYGPRHVDASLGAYGGQKAIEAEARGETQKVRITRHVADLMRTEFAGGSQRVASAQ